MQEPRIAYARPRTLGNLRYSTSNTGTGNLTDQKQGPIRAFAFLKPGHERTALVIQSCRDMSEGIPRADASWLANSLCLKTLSRKIVWA